MYIMAIHSRHGSRQVDSAVGPAVASEQCPAREEEEEDENESKDEDDSSSVDSGIPAPSCSILLISLTNHSIQ